MRLRYLFLTVIIAVCAGACAPLETVFAPAEMNIYGFEGDLPDGVLRQFEKEYGGMVTYETYSSNEEMLFGLGATPGRYDLIIISDYAVEILIARQGLRPLDLSAIPNQVNIQPAFLTPAFDPGGTVKYTLPFQWGTTGVAYDRTKVTSPLVSWRDLWRPELAGHLSVLDDPREMLGIGLQVLGYDRNSVDPRQLAAARDQLKALAPGIVAFDAAYPERRLISGETWAAAIYSGDAALAARGNANIVYVLPQEGGGLWFDNLAIPAAAPHPELAQRFIDFLLQADVGASVLSDLPYATSNQAALDYAREHLPALYREYVDDPISNPPPSAIAKTQPLLYLGEDANQLYEQYWAEVLAAGR
jgi:spermidine/putrescine transport system substrate-binding protein